ncbi:disease resistance rpp13-like protein 2-like, partial [Trifolium pratense]
STFSSIAGDTEFTSDIKRKLRYLETSSGLVDEMNSMCDALNKMHNQLEKAEATAGSNACVNQLTAIVKELEDKVVRFVNDTELNQIVMKNAIDLLQHLTKTCIIKKPESTKVVNLSLPLIFKEQDLVFNLTASIDNASKICIMGMKGVGKTILAKTVYYNKVIVEHFPTRVWITVIAGANKRTKVLLMKNDGTKYQTLTVKQVSGHLKDMDCLVVLDNVSQKNDFDDLYKKLCVSEWQRGSRMVVTTCFKEVALHVDSRSTVHHIPLLTKEESWSLFQKVAAIEKQEPDKKSELTEMETFAKKVVGKCGGLPLAILSLGFAISAKGIAQKSFLWVFEQFNHGRYKTHWLTTWENNRETLSESMRNCLYYFTKFPLDYEISARRLINLWVGEGLVEQNNQKTPEDTAESYLEDLRDRSMIQVVALKSNGKIKTCCLPSMLREIILQSNNRTNHSQYFDTHLDQRFAYNFDDHGLDANSTQAFRNKGIPVSVLFFDKREGSEPGKRVGNILSSGIESEQFLKTRVLDLECIFRPQLPETLSKLNNLKYLSIRWTYLEELPLCICKLLELETLDLKHTCINYIPSSIWKLKKLKKLYLPQNFRSKLEGKPRGNVEETLHTLWGVFLYGNYPLLGYLQNLKSLQKLKLAFQLNGSEQELQKTLAQKIVQLEQLHSLTLKSVDEIGDPEKLILTDMLKLEKLSSLRLFGQLEDTFHVRLLPKNLTDLTLSASKLSVDPMPELQLMPKLKSLCFYADSYIEKRMVCASGFQELKVLRFWNLEMLEELD